MSNISPNPVRLTTIALRVHHMDKMVAFYTEVFDATFRAVDTFGLASQFGEVAGITLKFVPIREAADFEEFPSHQLGFEVEDVQELIKLATTLDGRQEGELLNDNGNLHAAVRDPDGNTIELYQAA